MSISYILLGVEVTTLLIATGVVINQSVFIPILVSLLFIAIGNVMRRIKYNYFVGIKNPWTLANEEVWRKTHRMAAPVWVIGGILNILLAITGIHFNGIAFMIIVVAIIVVPNVYSYVVFHKIGNIDK